MFHSAAHSFSLTPAVACHTTIEKENALVNTTSNAAPPARTSPDGPLVYLVAGEASGDALAARLMAALKTATGGRIRFAGIGGARMAEQGLVSDFPMTELSIMGFAEVVPRIPRLLRRLRQSARAVRRLRPDAVVTVDSPGFAFRLARRIRSSGVPIVHYVAPQLWAWRPGRARHMAPLIDRLLVLLPFEPDFFKDFGVPCRYVGHPVVEAGLAGGDGPGFRARHGVAAQTPLVCVLPGSRHTEVAKHLSVFGRALGRLARSHAGLAAVVPLAPAVAAAVGAAAREWPVPVILLEGTGEKADAFAACDAALAKSGTGTLELALADLPMVVAYRVGALTAAIARRLLRVPYVALPNILLGRELVPEKLQAACTASELSEALDALLTDESSRAAQRAGFAEIRERLSPDGATPSERAAAAVLEVIGAARG